MTKFEELIAEQFHKDNFLIQTDNDKDGEKYAVIYCSSNGIYRNDTVEEFTKTILQRDSYEWYMTRIPYAQKHIFIRDVSKRIYQYGINDNGLDTIEKIAEMIKKETEGYKIITMGSSSGGYMSVVLGKLLNADYTIAFSPILKTFKPGIENKTITDDLRFDHLSYADSDVPVFYIYPNGSEWDIYNSDLMKGFKNIHFLPIKSSVHGVPLNKRMLKKLLEKDKETLKKICRYKTTEVITEFQLAKELGGFGFYLLRIFDYIKKYPLFFLRKDFYSLVIK